MCLITDTLYNNCLQQVVLSKASTNIIEPFQWVYTNLWRSLFSLTLTKLALCCDSYPRVISCILACTGYNNILTLCCFTLYNIKNIVIKFNRVKFNYFCCLVKAGLAFYAPIIKHSLILFIDKKLSEKNYSL